MTDVDLHGGAIEIVASRALNTIVLASLDRDGWEEMLGQDYAPSDVEEILEEVTRMVQRLDVKDATYWPAHQWLTERTATG